MVVIVTLSSFKDVPKEKTKVKLFVKLNKYKGFFN